MKKTGIVITLLFLAQLTFSQSAIHVEKSGKGNPIIFLPGFTSPGSVWDETIKNINGTYESHLVSYAGFNGLEPIGTPWYDPIKKQLIEYIIQNQLSNLTLIGHSMGGSLAIDLASELQKKVAGLILVDAIPCMREVMMPNVPANSLQYDSPYNNQILNMSNEDFKNMATGMCQYMTNDQSKVERLIDWSINADRKTYVYGFTDLLKLDLRDKLSNITAKTLVIGTYIPNKQTVMSNYEKQYSNLKKKEFALVENSKHFIMFDQPIWLNNQINKYLLLNVK